MSNRYKISTTTKKQRSLPYKKPKASLDSLNTISSFPTEANEKNVLKFYQRKSQEYYCLWPECNIVFYSERNLHKKGLLPHAKGHTGQSRLKCTKCPRYYSSISWLNKHTKKQNGNCSKSFYKIQTATTSSLTPHNYPTTTPCQDLTIDKITLNKVYIYDTQLIELLSSLTENRYFLPNYTTTALEHVE